MNIKDIVNNMKDGDDVEEIANNPIDGEENMEEILDGLRELDEEAEFNLAKEEERLRVMKQELEDLKQQNGEIDERVNNVHHRMENMIADARACLSESYTLRESLISYLNGG